MGWAWFGGGMVLGWLLRSAAGVFPTWRYDEFDSSDPPPTPPPTADERLAEIKLPATRKKGQWD